MTEVTEILLHMEAELIREKRMLTKIKELLIYKKDKELVNIAKNNIYRAQLKIREIEKIFKNREDSVKNNKI